MSNIKSRDFKVYILACINVYWGLLTVCNFKYLYNHKVRKVCKISYCMTSGGKGLIKILTITISERTGLVLTFSHYQSMENSGKRRFFSWLCLPVLQSHPENPGWLGHLQKEGKVAFYHEHSQCVGTSHWLVFMSYYSFPNSRSLSQK